MTCVAFDACVAASQRKLRRPVMIEADRGPFGRLVAGLAFRAVAPLMDVLQLMARVACGLSAFISLASVTCRASDLRVSAEQRESRPGMIERLHLAPVLFVVTTLARFAEPSFVRIVGFVAIDAKARCTAKLRLRRMAAFAGCQPVSAHELEARKIVIERLPIELNNISAAPFVICMAMAAFRANGVWPLAMKATRFLPVFRNVLVTRQAKPRL
jgi:hypothetical protein